MGVGLNSGLRSDTANHHCLCVFGHSVGDNKTSIRRQRGNHSSPDQVRVATVCWTTDS